jgi:hypothetical protein
VQDLQQNLLEDTVALQTALDVNPNIGASVVVVEKVAFDAIIDDGTGDGTGGGDDNNNAAIIGGVIGGSVLTLAVVALLMTRRRSNPLDGEDDDDDDDNDIPPPPPPLPKDVAGDLQAANGSSKTKTTVAAVPENMDPIIPASSSRTWQQQQTDVDYVLQPSPSANAPPPANSKMPAGAAAYTMRTTTPQKTAEVTMNQGSMSNISPITPARSVDSDDDMDTYSFAPGSTSAASAYISPAAKNKNKASNTVAEIAEVSDDDKDEYNSDNDESMFTYGNAGNDTSLIIGAGASILDADTVVDEYDNEDGPGHLTIKKPKRNGQRTYPTMTDNADVAAGNGSAQPGDSGQPFDEASDDMDQDLDAFAAELERAKAAATYLKSSEFSSPSSVKSDFAKNREAFEKSSKAKTIGRSPVMDR